MQVRIDSLHQPQIEFMHETQVMIDLFQHGVDDQRLAAGAAGEQVTIGSGYAVEELSKDHRISRSRMPISYQPRDETSAFRLDWQVSARGPFGPGAVVECLRFLADGVQR